MTAPGWYPEPSRPTDGYAIASVVVGAFGVPIVPIVLGVVARKRIRESGGTKNGNDLALLGILLGITQLVGLASVLLVFIWGLP